MLGDLCCRRRARVLRWLGCSAFLHFVTTLNFAVVVAHALYFAAIFVSALTGVILVWYLHLFSQSSLGMSDDEGEVQCGEEEEEEEEEEEQEAARASRGTLKRRR